MFRELKDRLLELIFSRMFVLLAVIVILFGVLINRIFQLQIINGESYQNNFILKIQREKTIPSTRGKIFDCNGKVLAYDELAYSVTIADNYESSSTKNADMNDTISRLIRLIEKNGDKLVNDFNIILDKDGNFVFNVEDRALLRFLADAYGRTKIEDLKFAEKNATPQEVVEYLAGEKRFAIGQKKEVDGKEIFIAGEGYTKEELIKILTIRYAMSFNSFQKYIPTVVATGVSEETVAVVMENKEELQGVDIAEDTIRKYIDDVSMSPILGYTGKISQEELEALNMGKSADDDISERYEINDMIGKAGIEQVMEEKLQGKKGSKLIYVDNLGRITETAKAVEPVAGNDLHLTIDSDLQSAIYHIIEQKLAGILVDKIRNVKEYHASAGASADDIIIPIDDVYFALFNNNVIDFQRMTEPNAGLNEKEVYQAYLSQNAQVLEALKEELLNTKTPYTALTTEMQVYESYIVSMLSSKNLGILMSDEIDTKDETYLAWKAETISLNEYLNHGIARNWIDITRLTMDGQYSSSEEVYQALVDNIIEMLSSNTGFAKKVLKYMIRDEKILGRQVCMLLFEQGIIKGSQDEKEALENGGISAYSFLLDKIKKLEITPAQLALDPCTGSCVVTKAQTGEVLACVTYPSYDNNRLANTIDAEYYNSLTTDLSNPLYSYATQQRTAPGSTFKLVSAVAGLQEGVTTLSEKIDCVGLYNRVDNPRCWKRTGHGLLDIVGGITNSCNFFFYEIGYRLGTDVAGRYDSELGLGKLAQYAEMFGLSEPSGIELSESEPRISSEDAVRSAIGHGTNNFTTVGLARYVTTIANSGTCFKLSLLDNLTDASGNVLEEYTPEVRNKIEIPDSTWEAVHLGMRGVVENASAFRNFPITAAGKTGTAQQIASRPNHAVFVGFAPFETPEISIATRIAYGYTSANAVEVSRDVMKYYFKLEDIEEIITGEAKRPDSTIAGD
ncbi:penicillin-binding protein [bacterium C-53]|nr:penicillin-binding protein [Lachnospiraceae bacterium]NBI01908.1 penicillin-binding protein [Lachnospiraceae bacterium]RKJ12311.1 penicillin-binding protein [bacterium C-53]